MLRSRFFLYRENPVDRGDKTPFHRVVYPASVFIFTKAIKQKDYTKILKEETVINFKLFIVYKVHQELTVSSYILSHGVRNNQVRTF